MSLSERGERGAPLDVLRAVVSAVALGAALLAAALPGFTPERWTPTGTGPGREASVDGAGLARVWSPQAPRDAVAAPLDDFDAPLEALAEQEEMREGKHQGCKPPSRHALPDDDVATTLVLASVGEVPAPPPRLVFSSRAPPPRS